jgi:hypothetical protein
MKKWYIVTIGMLTLIREPAWGLTDVTSPSGGIITLSSYFGTYNKPFDNDLTSAGRWVAVKSALPLYAQYQFTGGQTPTVTGYRVWSTAQLTRSPRDFTLSGSNNGSDWVVLDSRSGEINWQAVEGRVYTFANTTPYSYFRFTITANNGDSEYVALAELELFESDILTAAINPSPTNGATALKVLTTLSWSGNGASYDVFFGTNSGLSGSDFKTNVTFPAYSPGLLAYTNTYYWRIDAKDALSAVVTGATWSFTTTSPPPDRVAYDGFESYALTGLNGLGSAGGGWAGSWTALTNAMVVTTSMQYQAGQVAVHGGSRAVRISQVDADSVLRRDFTAQEGGLVYFSLLIKGTNPLGKRLAAGLKNSADGANYWQSGGFHFVHSDNTIVSEVYSDSQATRTSTGVVPTNNQTYFVVVRLQRTGVNLDFEKASVLVNPSSLVEPVSGWTTATYESATIALLNRFNLRIVLGMLPGEEYMIDELRIGTTYEAVISAGPVRGTVILFR